MMERAHAFTIAHCVADTDYRVLVCDQAYLDLVQRERSEVVGSNVLDLTFHLDRPLNARMLDTLTRSGTPFAMTKRYIRGDGSTLWVSNTVARVEGEPGNIRLCATSTALGPNLHRPTLTVNAVAVQKLCAAFAVGKQFFGPDLISAPAAEILLRVYAAELEGYAPAAHELACALRLSSGAAARWLKLLQVRGLIEADDAASASDATTFRIARPSHQALEELIRRIGL